MQKFGVSLRQITIWASVGIAHPILGTAMEVICSSAVLCCTEQIFRIRPVTGAIWTREGQAPTFWITAQILIRRLAIHCWAFDVRRVKLQNGVCAASEGIACRSGLATHIHV
jgi:hypothetical protein